MNNKVSVFVCECDSLSAPVGGAIKLAKTDIIVELHHSSFISCFSTSSQTSSQRENDPSGGALYFDVKSITVSKIYSSFCYAAVIGDVLYAAGPKSEFAHFDCLSDFRSGKKSSRDSTIYYIDGISTINSDSNFTEPIRTSTSGAFYLGRFQQKSTLTNMNIILNPDDPGVALGLCVEDGYSIKVTKCNIINSFVTNNEGIIILQYGINIFENIYIFESQGQLLLESGNPTYSFANSWFNPGVVYSSDSANQIDLLPNQPSFELIPIFCRFNGIGCSLNKKAPQKFSFALFLGCFFTE